jgi:hypothetical protein
MVHGDAGVVIAEVSEEAGLVQVHGDATVLIVEVGENGQRVTKRVTARASGPAVKEREAALGGFADRALVAGDEAVERMPPLDDLPRGPRESNLWFVELDDSGDRFAILRSNYPLPGR